MKERIFVSLMRELCAEEGIECRKLSYDKVLQLSKDGTVRHIEGNRFDLNTEAAGNIACDKYATYEVLTSQDVPIIKHVMVFNPEKNKKHIPEGGVWTNVVTEFLNEGTLVVKPNEGWQGQGVSLCRTLKDLECEIEKLFKTNVSLSICPYYDIDKEYRTFYLNGEVLLIYGKTKPSVVGDGKSSVKKLVDLLNLPNKKVVKENLSKLNMSYVPKEGEVVELSWKHNLSGGAIPKVLEAGELHNRITELVIKAGKAMNISFASIDVIHTKDDKLLVMEVNSGVCMTEFIKHVEGGYEIAKSVYRKALKAMFQ